PLPSWEGAGGWVPTLIGSQSLMSVQTPSRSTYSLLRALALVEQRVQWAVERARTADLQPDDAFRGLYISEEQVDRLLAREPLAWAGQPLVLAEAWAAWWAALAEAEEGDRLQQLVVQFGLSALETQALLLALAPALEPRFGALYAYLQDDVTQKRPSVHLLLNLLTADFGEKVLLRRCFEENGRLSQSDLLIIEPADTLLAAVVRVPDHIIAYLLGDDRLDPALAPFAQLLLSPTASAADGDAFGNNLIDLAQTGLGQTRLGQTVPSPLLLFSGRAGVGRREMAQRIAQSLGQPLISVVLTADFDQLPLLLRDGRMQRAVLYLDNWTALGEKTAVFHRLWPQLLAYPHLVILASEQPWQPSNHYQQRPIYAVPFALPDFAQRLALWERLLPERPLSLLEQLANQFRFTPAQIRDSVATAQNKAQQAGLDLSSDLLFAACRAHSNQSLAQLARKITPRYRWADIVLPPDTLAQLREIVETVRQRATVYGEWGFGRKMSLGKGVNVLFAGESGTGKTMSADIIAAELGLDLYKIDLASVVSKYIGETEKNLERIFTEAATSNAILFFDEADSIFGKRSEISDSHDRYANLEVSYLLQRMEMYEGIVILATNLRANIDDAFMRRLHFAIAFPFPEAVYREHIWRVSLPAATPCDDIDFRLLAERYPLAGGNIRNVVLAAAFLAATAEVPLGMAHVRHALRREYQKMGRLIDESLLGE
ncbi:MAG: ATP-binding protein, partial [Chloroflexota bacterium]